MKQTLKLFDTWTDKMYSVLENRTKVLNPFRLNPTKHIYQFALTPKQWAAFRMLRPVQNFRNAIRHTYSAQIENIPIEAGFHSFNVQIPRPDENHFYPDVRTDWDQLPKSVRQYILKWVEVHIELTKEQEVAWRTLHRVTDAVNTWGQLARVWPGLIPFFPDEEDDSEFRRCGRDRYGRRTQAKPVDWRRKAAMARTKPTLPTELTVNGEGGEADPLLIKRIDEAQWIFSQCMMLPKYKKEDHGRRPNVTFGSFG